MHLTPPLGTTGGTHVLNQANVGEGGVLPRRVPLARVSRQVQRQVGTAHRVRLETVQTARGDRSISANRLQGRELAEVACDDEAHPAERSAVAADELQAAVHECE
jgi:hypothetical protein